MSDRRATNWISMLVAITGVVATGCEESRAPAAAHVAAAAPVAEATPDADAVPAVNSAPDQTAAASGASTTASVQEPVAAPVKTAAPAGMQDITFDTIKFPLEKNEPFERSKLTPAIEALHGRNVKLRGYILPSFQQSGITQFVLVRDNMQCCFGPGAALYDCVVVDMKPGKTTDFTVRPVAVEGTFELRDFKGPDGKYLAIYHLDGEAVRF